MEMTTAVGALRFVLEGTGYAAWPDVPLTGLSLVEGRPLAAATEGDSRFLVLDNRTSPAPGTAWVEYWRPRSHSEGALEGLFVLSDAHASAGDPPALPLGALARALPAPRQGSR